MMLHSSHEFEATRASNFYVFTLDPEDPNSVEVHDIEIKALQTYGFFGDKSYNFASTAVIKACTPLAVHSAINAIGNRTSRASFATLSGHGSSASEGIMMTTARIMEALGVVAGFAKLLRNVDVFFIAACDSKEHLTDYMSQTPGTDLQRPILIGYDHKLAATRSVLASAIIQRTIESGVDLREGHDQLKLPGEGFWILYPGMSEPEPVKSISAGAESKWVSLAQEHLANLASL